MHPPSDKPLPPMEPLAKAPFPAADEHFGSWIRRLAMANGLDTVGALVTRLGLITITPQSSDRAWLRLIEATGFDPVRLDPLRTRRLGIGRVQTVAFGPTHIQVGFLDHARLRSCPLCLAQDGHLPRRFSLRQATACTMHGVRLSDACSCGRERRIFDRKSLWGCPNCGIPTDRLPAEPADPRELVISRLLTFDSKMTDLPFALSAEPLNSRAAVVERLGRLSLLERNDSPSPSRHNVTRRLPDGVPKNRTIQEDRETAMAAADLLENWPVRYHALLDRLVDRYADPEAATPILRRFSSSAGHVAVRNFVDHDGRSIAFAEEARLTYLRERLGHVPDEELQLRRSEHYANMPCIPRGPISTLRNEANFVSAFEFGNRLHVGDRFHIEAWFEAGLARTVRHTDGSVLFARDDFDALLARVQTLPNAKGDAADFQSSVTINNRRGAFYKQRYFLEDILSGRIRSRASDEGSEGMKSRLIHRLDFDRQRMLCKTAIQIIRDDFVGVASFVPVLWNVPIPRKRQLDGLMNEGRIRAVKGARGFRYSVRNLVDLIQHQTGRRLLSTDGESLVAVKYDDWRHILVEDSLCANRA